MSADWSDKKSAVAVATAARKFFWGDTQNERNGSAGLLLSPLMYVSLRRTRLSATVSELMTPCQSNRDETTGGLKRKISINSLLKLRAAAFCSTPLTSSTVPTFSSYHSFFKNN
jgi:hypothetical protein